MNEDLEPNNINYIIKLYLTKHYLMHFDITIDKNIYI